MADVRLDHMVTSLHVRPERDAQRLASSEFGRTLKSLADKIGTPSININVRRGGKSASVNASTRTIFVPEAVLRASIERQRWAAAHEYAHIVLRHGDDEPGEKVGRWLTVAACVPIVVDLIGLLPPMPAPLLPFAELLILIGVATVLLMVARLTPRLRANELAADREAARWGHPITPEIADDLRAVEGRLSQLRLFRPLRTHPYPNERVAALTRL